MFYPIVFGEELSCFYSWGCWDCVLGVKWCTVFRHYFWASFLYQIHIYWVASVTKIWLDLFEAVDEMIIKHMWILPSNMSFGNRQVTK